MLTTCTGLAGDGVDLNIFYFSHTEHEFSKAKCDNMLSNLEIEFSYHVDH